MPKHSLDDLTIFIAAANQLSLTRAAQQLSMTVATVSRRISALEANLGVELLYRSPKGLTLTPHGETYYQECEALVQALEQRMDNLDHTLHSLSGPLKVMAPVNLSCGPMDIFWRDFIKRYPDITLTIELDNNVQDIRDQQADIALRSGTQTDATLIQRHLGHIEPLLVASPTMAHAMPTTLEELAACPSVAAHMFSDWLLFQTNGEGHGYPLQKAHRHVSNDMQLVLNLVKAGAGVALIPASLVSHSLSSKELVRVMPTWHGQNRDIYLVWPSRRSLSVRAKLFRDELTDYFHRQDWFNAARKG